ncbi:MAG: hypothetical protein ACR2MQ_04580 [Gemmatimonadaceae bacterium]
MKKLFTERHGEAKPRISEVLGNDVRDGLLELVAARVDEEWFGSTYPERCADGYPNAGTDRQKLRAALKMYRLTLPSLDQQPSVSWGEPIPEPPAPPTDAEVFDLLEFSYEVIAEPIPGQYHSYMGHTHYTYDQEKGRERFAADMNRIFERNGIAFEVRDGEVSRLAPAPLHQALALAQFSTGDTTLDVLLEDARRKFLHRDFKMRSESLEKIWDAWERLKTIEQAKDKKASVGAILDKAAIAAPAFRDRLEKEAKELTEIGNSFMIRHTEVGKVPITESGHVDYLFHRVFALIALLLRSSGRFS